MRPIRISIPARTTDQKLEARAGRITWYSFAETTGAAPASFVLYDGNDTTGSIVMPVNLLANESTREYTGHEGVPYMGGLYLHIISGSITGAVVCVSEENWWSWGTILDGLRRTNA